MKRKVFALVSYILMLTFLAANPAMAAHLNPTKLNSQIVVSASTLNVRSAPTATADKIGSLNKGAVVTATAVKDGWFSVILPSNQQGWVSGDYVYTQGTDPAKKLITSDLVTVTAQTANVRSGAGDSFSVVATMKTGNTAVVINSQGDWINIRLADGKQGFIKQSAVSKAKMILSTSGKPAPVGSFVKADSQQPSPAPSPAPTQPAPSQPAPTQPNPSPNPPAQQPSNPGETKILSLDGSTGNANTNILKLEAVVINNEFILRHTSDKPVSYSTKREGSQIVVTVREALGIAEGHYDINTGSINSLQVVTNSTDTILFINTSEDVSFSTQNVPDKVQFLIKISVGAATPSPSPGGSLADKVIVLDAGHGGMHSGFSDPGAVGPSKLKERDVVLDITNKTKALLEAQGAKIIMTREGDETQLTLNGRAELANNNKADIYVSIHANANVNPNIAGTSTYFYAPAGTTQGAQREQRKKLAQLVQDGMMEKLQRRNIGILEANFAVIRLTTMPSILVETAFISNPEEEALLATDAFRTKAAEGIANGIVNYFTK